MLQSTVSPDQVAKHMPGSRTGWLGALGFLCQTGLAIWLGGFLAFASWVGEMRPVDVGPADGIVVLTGGRERIHGAIELLRGGKAKRLLITGVYHNTRSEDLARFGQVSEDLLRCCIDLGFAAETTIGNAREAADWTRAHGFSSLIVVTSAYHLPRSLIEFRSLMPEIALTPYPVHHADLDLPHWYTNQDAAKLLFVEYLKYSFARTRAALLPALPGWSGSN